VDISRSQSIKNNIYQFLLQKREEAALSYASTVSDSRLIDQAESGANPVSPNRNLVYGIACIIALCIPVGFVSLKELFNKKIIFRNEIEELINFPVIGEIGQDNTKKDIVISEGERSYIAEQFRQIRTTLPYLGLDGKLRKKILITSAVPGEGKSFVASNLAMSLALTEKKVALLELDLRKPKLGDIFSSKNKIGLSDYLKGKVSKEEIINPTRLSENLFVIYSGNAVNNPSELLLNPRLKELLDYLNDTYDYIIMETGPVNAVTDAFIISDLSDSTLFVVRYNFTAREHINVLKDHLKVRELKNPAIIFNGVKSIGFGKYGSVYNYAEKTTKKKDLAVL
jgi:capsular exopolysaccharide synthesis family protein